MLYAVEGGFISTSASGYSKGLSFLFNQNNEDNPMKVLPWHEYEYEYEPLSKESERNPLDKEKHCPSTCTSSACIGLLSSGFDLKVGQQRHNLLCNQVETDKYSNQLSKYKNIDTTRGILVKSSLKKSTPSISSHSTESCSQNITSNLGKLSRHDTRRKVHWTDACGRALTEVKEYVPSEVGGSDDEQGNRNGFGSCSCIIM